MFSEFISGFCFQFLLCSGWMAQLVEYSLIWSQLLIVTIWKINFLTLTGENINSISILRPSARSFNQLTRSLSQLCCWDLNDGWSSWNKMVTNGVLELGAAIKPAHHPWKVLLRPPWLGGWGHYQVWGRRGSGFISSKRAKRLSAQDEERKFNFLLSHVMDQGPSFEALEAEVVGAMLRRLVVISTQKASDMQICESKA